MPGSRTASFAEKSVMYSPNSPSSSYHIWEKAQDIYTCTQLNSSSPPDLAACILGPDGTQQVVYIRDVQLTKACEACK